MVQVRFGSVAVWVWNSSGGSGLRFRQCKYLMYCMFPCPSLAADNQGAWVGLVNRLAASNLVLNLPLPSDYPLEKYYLHFS